MKRTKLEMYIDILHLLAEDGPLKLTHLTNSADINSHQIRQQIEFLIRQGMVIEEPVGKVRVAYLITKRGSRALQFFRSEKPALRIVEKIRETQF